MKKLQNESGQVLVLTALCMTVLIGFMALAIDVGILYRAKRNMQIAADAAATAAALDYFYNRGSSTAVAAAKTVGTSAANVNGYTTSSGATITINSGTNSEITTPWHNSTSFFEAIVSQPSRTAFMGYFGVGSMNVSTRAVAGVPGGSKKDCIYILAPTGNLGPGKSGSGTSTVWLQGSFQLNAPNCGIQIDGTSSNTLYYNGNGGSTSAAFIAVVGGVGGNSSGYTPQPVTGVAPVSDPLTRYTIPTAASCTSTVTTSTGSIGSATGIVCDSASNITNATFTGTVVLTAPTVTFGGSIATIGGATGAGATIVFDTGSFNESPGTNFSLYAPSSGALAGIVLAAPTTNTSTMTLQFGNSTGTFNGIVYMPAATFFFQDSGGDHSGGLTFNIDLVVAQLDDKTSKLNINGYSPPGAIGPLDLVTLVE